jgi:hypothetical protein
MVRQLLICLGALWPLAAPAQQVDYGSIDGFYVPYAGARWPDAADADGAGFGARVLSRATDRIMVLGELHALSYDDPGPSITQLRIGAGWALPSTTGVFATYDRLDLDTENANALGVHLRVAERVWQPLSLYGQAGYVVTDARSFYFDGFEFTLGATYDLPEPWGLFADYRATLLDDRDSTARLHREELRVGVRFRFDC